MNRGTALQNYESSREGNEEDAHPIFKKEHSEEIKDIHLMPTYERKHRYHPPIVKHESDPVTLEKLEPVRGEQDL
jgi:hypothetical protein